MPRYGISQVLGLVGAILGGVVGWLAAGFLADRGYYAMALPGLFIGVGCGMLARDRSLARGITCGVGSLMLSLSAEWSHFPFLKDPTPSFFISHLHWLPAWKWAFHGFGAVLAFWCGRDPFGSLFHRPGARPR